MGVSKSWLIFGASLKYFKYFNLGGFQIAWKFTGMGVTTWKDEVPINKCLSFWYGQHTVLINHLTGKNLEMQLKLQKDSLFNPYHILLSKGPNFHHSWKFLASKAKSIHLHSFCDLLGEDVLLIIPVGNLLQKLTFQSFAVSKCNFV